MAFSCVSANVPVNDDLEIPDLHHHDACVVRLQFLSVLESEGNRIVTQKCGKQFMYRYKFGYRGDRLSFYLVNLMFSDL